jgi:hypothetical protein
VLAPGVRRQSAFAAAFATLTTAATSAAATLGRATGGRILAREDDYLLAGAADVGRKDASDRTVSEAALDVAGATAPGCDPQLV